jgi:hypothetical protein
VRASRARTPPRRAAARARLSWWLSSAAAAVLSSLSSWSSSTSWSSTTTGSTRNAPTPKATSRRRTSARGSRARPRVTMQSSHEPHASIHVAARGEAHRARRHREPWRRRGASPECSVSAGLHPSPGTVHPRRHKAGEGGRAEHRDWMRTRASENGEVPPSPSHFPRSGRDSLPVTDILPVQSYFLPTPTVYSQVREFSQHTPLRSV